MENLRKIRKARKMTQKELGKLVGVTESSISQYEKGKKTPSFEIALKLAEALDCESADLVSKRDVAINIKPSLDNVVKYSDIEKPATIDGDGEKPDSVDELNDYAFSVFKQLPIEAKISVIGQMQAELQNQQVQDAPEESV